MMITDTHFD